MPKAAFPDDFAFAVGESVQGLTPEGKPLVATIVSFDDDVVRLDHNHPLAGEDLNFEVELVEVL